MVATRSPAYRIASATELCSCAKFWIFGRGTVLRWWLTPRNPVRSCSVLFEREAEGQPAFYPFRSRLLQEKLLPLLDLLVFLINPYNPHPLQIHQDRGKQIWIDLAFDQLFKLID